ncbi:anthranilate synthase component II [Metarhizium anisopliae]|nr:anthranilate synthase component II [Metarhizium anisopliae]
MPRNSFSSPKPIFRGRVIAAAGPLPDKNTVENFKNWTKLRKGEFRTTFDESVTHLLCSEEQFNADNAIGSMTPTQAPAMLKCHIVRYEWFLLSMGGREARQPEQDYDLRAKYNKKKEKARRAIRLERGKRLAERFIDPNLYQIFDDDLLFPYKVELTRLTVHGPEADPEREQLEKYTLCLYKSRAKPHLYWFAAKYSKSKGDTQPHYYRETDFPTLQHTQMDAFRAFFKLKTGIPWSERIIRQATMPAEYFQYTAPTGGKSTGRDKLWSRYFCFELNRAIRGPSLDEIDTSEGQEQGVPGTDGDQDARSSQSGDSEGLFGRDMDIDSNDADRDPCDN